MRAKAHLCPQLVQEILQNLMFYPLKFSHCTQNPPQAVLSAPYTRGKCLEIRCILQQKAEQGVVYINLRGNKVLILLLPPCSSMHKDYRFPLV